MPESATVGRVSEIFESMNKIPMPKVRTEPATTIEEILVWRYSAADTEPPYDPELTGIPSAAAKFQFSKLTKPREQVFSKHMITSLETISPSTMLKKKVLYAQYV